MVIKRGTGTATLLCLAHLPLWGGTGSPRDGFLSFILLFGFLLILLGIIDVARFVKKIFQDFLDDIY